jgi:hypothetical protein
VAIFPGKTSELKTIRIGSWVENNILLFDLGYFKYEMFSGAAVKAEKLMR